PGIELDFYPDFCCRKPKSNWNLTKFDSKTSETKSSPSYTPTARSTVIPFSPKFGKRASSTSTSILSTPTSIPSPLQFLTLREETPNTRNVLTSFDPDPTTSNSRPIIGTPLPPQPLEIVDPPLPF